MSAAQIDLFGTDAPQSERKKQKRRDVDAEARRLLEQSGISSLRRDEKEYVLAQLIAQWFPELKTTLGLSLILSMQHDINPENKHG